MIIENAIKISNIEEEKEVLAVLKARVINGQEVESELIGIYEDEEELIRAKKKIEIGGHKTVVRVKVKVEPIEYLGDVYNIN